MDRDDMCFLESCTCALAKQFDLSYYSLQDHYSFVYTNNASKKSSGEGVYLSFTTPENKNEFLASLYILDQEHGVINSEFAYGWSLVFDSYNREQTRKKLIEMITTVVLIKSCK